ncbi:BQ5605_C039g11779 [Microbotryum silenes-dioicae]|uniref:BQ5605_C039g11779 protein n=1 Tax=Microbotryum silenes-dioicae TaxID=796604 RepID=A0A2X0P9S5_9BASI|nr:BQ5605_C039g11779 [Microbotryum silenes-dioicae]
MESNKDGEFCEVDMEADCKTHRGLGSATSSKDRALPVDPRKIPRFDDAKLASLPEGYRYLAYRQSSAYKIK